MLTANFPKMLIKKKDKILISVIYRTTSCCWQTWETWQTQQHPFRFVNLECPDYGRGRKHKITKNRSKYWQEEEGKEDISWPELLIRGWHANRETQHTVLHTQRNTVKPKIFLLCLVLTTKSEWRLMEITQNMYKTLGIFQKCILFAFSTF